MTNFVLADIRISPTQEIGEVPVANCTVSANEA